MKTYFAPFVLFFYLLSSSATLLGANVTPCYFTDKSKHEINRKLLERTLMNELASMSSHLNPSQKAEILNGRITDITRELMRKGFHNDIYMTPPASNESYLAFQFFTFYEGQNINVPVIFMLGVWPSEIEALKFNQSDPCNCCYGSNIHSHPFTCAFTVLQGSIIQENYELVSDVSAKDKVVKLVDEEYFHTGQGCVDDQTKPFIHRLVCRHNISKPCLTLHIYGVPSEAQFKEIYKKTEEECSFDYILEEDGAISPLS